MRFFFATVCSLFLLLRGLISFAQGETAVSGTILPSAKIEIARDKGSEFLLEVRQLPLAQVLKELSAKTNTPIHYSVLPEGLITATCAGSSLKPVLECLLNRKADIIVRYVHGKTGKAENDKIAEAWVLGSKLEALPTSAACKADAAQGSISLNMIEANPETGAQLKPSQSDLLLEISKTGNPTDRAQAISDLLTIGGQNDPKVKSMLETAAHDPDANVRAQAISTLTHRDDYSENAEAIIQDALQDESVDVRLMAVDGITGDAGLLQQAINDPDETVRSIAASKLDELSKMNQAEP